MDWARPNVFQRLVRCWEALHPYNGAQVVELATPLPDTSTLQRCWADTLDQLGLGRIVWADARQTRYRFEPAARLPVELSRGASVGSWDDLLSGELNHAYGEEEVPLRLLAGSLPDGGCRLGIAYRHWVADSVAIRRVLGTLVSAVTSVSLPVSRGRYRLPEEGYWRLFGPGDFGGGGRWCLLPAILASATQASRSRRAGRCPATSGDLTVAFSGRVIRGIVSPLLACARRQRVRLNDVLLASLARAVHRHGPQALTTRRPDLALGTIVDLRRFAASDLQDRFGLYLGFTTTFLRPSHLQDLATAIHAVARQAALHRRQHAAPASQLRMGLGLLAHHVLDPESVLQWYRKRLPLAAGISNVNLSGDWPDAGHPLRVRGYLRVSPAGPLMPLVLSVTTLGEDLHLGLTRRIRLVDEATGERLLDDVEAQLHDVAGGRHLPVRPVA